MKINKKQLQTLVRETVKKKLTEGVYGKDTEGEDKKLNDFLDKVDKTLGKCREDLSDLLESGEVLARDDVDAKERNAVLVMVMGILRKLHMIFVQSVEVMKRSTG